MRAVTSISVVGPGEACLLFLTPTTPPLVGVGGVPARAAVPGCPLRWPTLPWATGVGRHTSPRSAKASGILGLLGQRFSDIAELWLGAGVDPWGRVSPPLEKTPWDEVLSPQGQLGRGTEAGCRGLAERQRMPHQNFEAGSGGGSWV